MQLAYLDQTEHLWWEEGPQPRRGILSADVKRPAGPVAFRHYACAKAVIELHTSRQTHTVSSSAAVRRQGCTKAGVQSNIQETVQMTVALHHMAVALHHIACAARHERHKYP